MPSKRSFQIFLETRRGGNFCFAENFRMYAHDQAFLVMRAVENADPPALGHALGHAPEKIVIELVRRRRLEGVHVAAHRIDAVEDVLDDAVLAGCVHALQDQEHRPSVLGVKPLLQIGEMLGMLGDDFLGLLLADREPAGIGWIVIRKLEGLRLVDAEALGPACRDS